MKRTKLILEISDALSKNYWTLSGNINRFNHLWKTLTPWILSKNGHESKISLKNKQKYSSAVDGMLKYSNMALKRYSFYSGKMKQNLSFPKNNPQLT